MVGGTTGAIVSAFLGTIPAHAGGQFDAPYYGAPTDVSPESVNVGDLDGDVELADPSLLRENFGIACV